MGGVPVLMLIASMGMGITYGWQPDESGDGVEYIVQVPPSEIDQLRRIGEISSAIDPRVRGRVSKIVIRVGDGPLPRKTPLGTVAQSDVSPIPIPQMSNPASGDGVLTSSAQTTLMKPDPQSGSTGQSGFSFPNSLPPSLADIPDNARKNFDQAGREIVDRAGEQLKRAFGGGNANANAAAAGADPRLSGVVPPPATRSRTGSNSSFEPPAFVGPPNLGNNQSGQGWPSTSPATRDNSWGDPSLASRNGSPSTNPAARDANETNPFATTGLRSTDTFGRPPAGLSTPTAYGRDVQANSNPAARNPATPQPTQYEQLLADQRARELQQLAMDDAAARTRATTTSPRPGYESVSGAAPNRPDYREATSTTPDSRLSTAQVNAGAWFVDESERIFDTRRNLMPGERLGLASSSFGYPASTYPNSSAYPNAASPPVDPRYATNSTQSRQPRTYDSTSVAPPAFASPSDRDTNGQSRQAADDRWPPSRPVSAPSTGYDNRRPAYETDRSYADRYPEEQSSAYRENPPASRADYETRTRPAAQNPVSTTPAVGTSPISFEPAPEIAAQRLFNGLLLISFVANVYLVFWLKNLRLQFRDMVATKRLAGNGGSAA
ncbi:hypothetical protein Poly51_31530 [Rubripirellula tenax]|uniref:Uncharacterized protein n=1 Tax=Rubripirellula tenax TaxID=2528015 RepID=A0A5C6F1G7_9BACT|nr:hypothetical protein [Rubripirellula tenax]TWU54434.1 hypothetical protein Poly51_31530 [Rubripirellula tenax]